MKHSETTELGAPTNLLPNWVMASKYAEQTGVTPNAIHQRRKEGIWLDGKHCAVVARRLYVNVKEADKWIESQASQPRRAF